MLSIPLINKHKRVLRHKFDRALYKIGFTELIADMTDAGIAGKRVNSIKYPRNCSPCEIGRAWIL